MFLDYFALIEQPFGVTPDPRFLHLGPNHREALASLIYGTENNRGFMALIAPPGMGKTSLLFHYLESVRNQARTAFLFQSARDSRDLLRYLLSDLGVNSSGKSIPEMHESLNKILTDEMRAGRRLILAIDEAQNLDEKVLESIRVLSNFETSWMKLMQIVIAGQPQLTEMLARPSMAQLRQRISSIIRLEPFTQQETNEYIDHRLWVAGYSGPPLFTVGARLLIGQHSSGIPRNINNLCFHSMGLALASGKKQVDSHMVREVISELSLDSNCSDIGVLKTESLPEAGERAVASLTSIATTRTAARPTSRLVFAMLIVSAVLFLGLVSGASWKTDAGSFATAKVPSPHAAAFPAPTPPVVSAPETPPSLVVTAHVDKSQPSGPAATPAETAQNSSVASVVVEKNVTLRHLCLLYVGRFDSKTLAVIRELNPAISDPDRLQAGQQIRLPLYLRRDSPNHAKGPGKTSVPEKTSASPEGQP